MSVSASNSKPAFQLPINFEVNEKSAAVEASDKQKKEISFEHDHNLSRVAVNGIGRKLKIIDIGSKMVRTTPVQGTFAGDGDDWSFIPKTPDLSAAIKASCVVLDFNEDFFILKGSDSKTTYKFSSQNEWVENWLSPEEFANFFENNCCKISLTQLVELTKFIVGQAQKEIGYIHYQIPASAISAAAK